MRRTTLKDIARATGYGTTTVSLALRENGKIPEPTRQRIRQAARELGYARDPMLSALVAYRTGNRARRAWQGQIAAVSLNRHHPWRANPSWERILDAMHGASAENGYELEECLIDTDGTSPQRHLEILHARGVAGLILQPTRAFDDSICDWDRFSVINFGFDLSRRFHTVTTDNFRAAAECLERAIAAGYRRIGLLIRESMLNPHHYREIGAILAHRELRTGVKLFFLKKNPDSPAARRQWLQRNRIELVIGRNSSFQAADAWAVPYLDINVGGIGSPVSGVHFPPRVIGATLVSQLHGLIQRGEKGLAEVPLSVHVSGQWNPGTTLTPEAAGAAPAVGNVR